MQMILYGIGRKLYPLCAKAIHPSLHKKQEVMSTTFPAKFDRGGGLSDWTVKDANCVLRKPSLIFLHYIYPSILRVTFLSY
jgi:hypothetical protein